jgi:uncharacterized membrane protein YphA (DoxX/SURF4 family)
MAGGTKLNGMEMHVQNFETWGLGIHFMYLIGLTEMLAAIALLLGTFLGEAKSQWVAVHILNVVMGGAMATHWFNSETEAMVAPGVLAVMLLGILLTSKRESSEE